MNPVIDDRDMKIYQGDVRVVLPQLPPNSVDCAITSPPFWNLRDYGVDGQIGLEQTPEMWAQELVGVCSLLAPVLRPHATLWVEVGDCYASNWGMGAKRASSWWSTKSGELEGKGWGVETNIPPNSFRGKREDKLKVKDLVGAPWLFAFAMRDAGWYLRQCIIWNKPNAMPESAKDRCTTAHSYIFLFAKREKYYFDPVAIQEPAEWARWGDQTTPKYNGTDTSSGWMKGKLKEELPKNPTKNPRSVWSIPTGGYDGAHFAVFPEALVERMLKAACPPEVCVTCHTPRERIMSQSEGLAYEGEAPSTGRPDGEERRNLRGGQREWDSYVPSQHVGWTDCGCGKGWTPGTVLDFFMGSGTTAVVARRLGLHSVGVELNPEYLDLIRKRTEQLSLLA